MYRAFHIKSITPKSDLLFAFEFFAMLKILVENNKLHVFESDEICQLDFF
jgi:hypothetical protein